MDRRDLEDVLVALGSARTVIDLLERCPPTPRRDYQLGELAEMVRMCRAELNRREALVEDVLALCR